MLISSQDHGSIEQKRTQLTTAIGSSDIPSIAGIFSDNAVLLAPRRNLVRGKDIRRFWRNMSRQLREVNFAAQDLESLGSDTVRETGSLTFQAGEQGSEPISCKYLLVWHKQESDWKLAAMCWSRLAGNQATQAGA